MHAVPFLLVLALGCPSSEPAPTAPTPEPAAAPAEPAEPAAPAEVKLHEAGIDRLAITDHGERGWEAEVADAAAVARIVDALVYTDAEPSGGKTRWSITCFAGEEKVEEVWIFPDGEWGYGSATRGQSDDLAALLGGLPDELGIELGEGE